MLFLNKNTTKALGEGGKEAERRGDKASHTQGALLCAL
jgi:hypothetical protein